jgi:serine/threonine-protein kinase
VAWVIGQTLLGRYTVEELVAEGGMGVVYRARDLATGGAVGIKRLRGDVEASAELLARFEREANVQAMLNHPNIAALYAVGAAEDGALFMVMELVDGESLGDAVASGALPPARAIRIATQVLRALDYAHQFELVHRDLKPDNVLLAQPGTGSEQAKVIDFGLVKLLGDVYGDGAASRGVTAAGSLFGTPQYMAPEFITGEGVDARIDLYAMGVMLFVMLTGRPPYDHTEITELWRMHLYAPIPPLVSFAPHLTDGHLDAIVSTLLAKRPDERFETAGAAARALQSCA